MRILIGPLNKKEHDHILSSFDGHEVISFGDHDADILYSFAGNNWQDIIAGLPVGWSPDFVVFWCHEYFAIPIGLEDSPWPVVGLIGDWNLGFEAVKQTAYIFDYLFTDRQGVEVLKRHGINNADYLPLFSYIPSYHKVIPGVEKIYDIVFAGNLNHSVQRERSHWLNRLSMLSDRYKVRILTGIYGDDYTRALNQAKIVFNRSIRGEMNARAYEAPACGSLLFMEESNLEIRDYLTDMVECVLYNDENLEELIGYYITHDEERERIARNGYNKIQKYQHSHHMKLLVEKVKALGICGRRHENATPVLHCARASQIYLSITDGRFEVAERELEEAEKIAPDNPEMLNNRGVVYSGYAGSLQDQKIKMEFYGYAEEYFRKAISVNPYYAVAIFNLANLYLDTNRLDEGENRLNEVIRILENDIVSATTVLGLFSSLNYDFFRVERERIAFEYTGRDYRKETGHLILYKALERLGDINASLNLYHNALIAYENASVIKPENGTLLYKYGRLLLKNGNTERAVEQFHTAIKAEPFLFDSMVELAGLLDKSGRYIERDRIVSKSLKIIDACPSYSRYKPSLTFGNITSTEIHPPYYYAKKFCPVPERQVKKISDNQGSGKPVVLFAARYFYPLIGGAEHTANTFLNDLAENGYKCAALCGGGPSDSLQYSGSVPVYSVHERKHIEAFFDEYNPEIVITQLEWSPAIVEIAKERGKPVVLIIPSYENICPAPVDMMSCDRRCNLCRHFTSASNSMKAHREMLIKVDRILCYSRFLSDTVRQFIDRDTDVWYQPMDYSAAQYRVKSDNKESRYITMCTAAPYKGLYTFIEIAKRMPDQQFLIVGRGSPEYFGVDTRKVPNLTVWGSVDPSVFLEETKILIAPAVWPEPFGRTPLEAMANGIPVIASAVGGLPEALGDAGLLVYDYLSSEAWVTSLRNMLNNSGLKNYLVDKGHTQCNKFSKEKLMPYLYETIDSLCYKNGASISQGSQGEIQIPLNPPFSKGGESGVLTKDNENNTMDIQVVWEGNQFVYSSLALINRELCLSLIENSKIDLSIIPENEHKFDEMSDSRFAKLSARFNKTLSVPASVHVRHQWPPDFTKPDSGQLVIIQPWEFGSLPRIWIDPIQDNVSEVWVPSRYVRRVYTDSGIDAQKVIVIPNGVNTSIFRPEGNRMELDTGKRFKFLFVGGTFYRKGIDILLDTYLRTFTSNDNIVLVIKDFGSKSFYKGQSNSKLIKEIQRTPNAPEILYIEKELTEQDMPALYRACDCLVHPYRGEGFGLPVLEAMACGLPVVVTDGGSTDDFVDDSTGFRVPSKRVYGEKMVGELETVSETWHLEIDRNVLSRIMKEIYFNPFLLPEMGMEASRKASAYFNWKDISNKVMERLKFLSRQ